MFSPVNPTGSLEDESYIHSSSLLPVLSTGHQITSKKLIQRQRDRQTGRDTERQRQRKTQRDRDKERQRHRETETQRKTQRDRQTDRDRETETERKTQRQRDTETDRQTEIELVPTTVPGHQDESVIQIK